MRSKTMLQTVNAPTAARLSTLCILEASWMKPGRCAGLFSRAAGQGWCAVRCAWSREFIPSPMPATPTRLQAIATAHNAPARVCGMLGGK